MIGKKFFLIGIPCQARGPAAHAAPQHWAPDERAIEAGHPLPNQTCARFAARARLDQAHAPLPEANLCARPRLLDDQRACGIPANGESDDAESLPFVAFHHVELLWVKLQNLVTAAVQDSGNKLATDLDHGIAAGVFHPKMTSFGAASQTDSEGMRPLQIGVLFAQVSSRSAYLERIPGWFVEPSPVAVMLQEAMQVSHETRVLLGGVRPPNKTTVPVNSKTCG